MDWLWKTLQVEAWLGAVSANPALGAVVALLLLVATLGPVLVAMRQSRLEARQSQLDLLPPETQRLLARALPAAALKGPRAQVIAELLDACKQAEGKLPCHIAEMYVAGGAFHLDAAGHEAEAQCVLVCRVRGATVTPDGGSAVAMVGGTPEPTTEARFLADHVVPEILPEHMAKFPTPVEALPTAIGAALQKLGKPAELRAPLALVLMDWVYGLTWDVWTLDAQAPSHRTAAGPGRSAAKVPPWDAVRLTTIVLRRHLRVVTAGPLVLVPPNELRGIRFGAHVDFHLLWTEGDDLNAVARNLAAAFAHQHADAPESDADDRDPNDDPKKER